MVDIVSEQAVIDAISMRCATQGFLRTLLTQPPRPPTEGALVAVCARTTLGGNMRDLRASILHSSGG